MSQSTIINSNIKKKFPLKKIIIAAAVLILIGIIAFVGFRYIWSKEAKNAIKPETVAVQKGDISVTVSGSGPITSSNKYDITSNVNGTITKINYKDGDKVKAGDVLIEIDDQDAQLKVRQLENSISQAKLSQEYNRKSLDGVRLTAPISGEVTDLQVKIGDNVSKNGAVLTITDKSRFKMLGSFSNNLRKNLRVGQQVTINALDTATDELYTLKGSISSIGAPSYKTADGSEVYNVEVMVNNPGSLKEGLVGNIVTTAAGKEIKSTGSSTLNYIDSMVVKSESGGVVEKLNVENGKIVTKGTDLADFSNDDLVLTTNTDNLKLQDLEIQLETAEQQLTYYKITAPIDGTITVGDIKQGNSIKAGDILGSIANYDTMEFEIPIDELDIAKIQIGQPANITIDALPDTSAKPLKGTVSKIAIEGTSTNGVTTYPVTIQIEPDNALKGGMNANAEIITSSKTGVLYLPIQAVQKRGNRSFVMVKGVNGAGGSNGFAQGNFNNSNGGANNGNINNSNGNRSNNGNGTANSSGNSGANRSTNRNSSGQGVNAQMQKYYAGAAMKSVQTGISNDEYIEIVSGLKEGDIVILPPTISSQSSGQLGAPFGGGAMRVPMGGGAGGGQNVRRN